MTDYMFFVWIAGIIACGFLAVISYTQAGNVPENKAGLWYVSAILWAIGMIICLIGLAKDADGGRAIVEVGLWTSLMLT